MSDDDVYRGEMPRRRFSDQDVELLLSGGTPGDDELARLAPILEAMQAGYVRQPSDAEIARFATEAAAVVTATPPSPHRPPSRRRLAIQTTSKRLVGAAAGVILLLGMTGVAAASDAAVPGDLLYGLDRALERIGVGDGGSAERIEEAQALLDEGLVAEAIAHTAEAVEEGAAGAGEVLSPEENRAGDALRDAADQVGTEGDEGPNTDVKDTVAAMLDEIAAMIDSERFDGRELGQRIAELARAIGGETSGPPPGVGNGNGPPDEVPGGPPEDPPAGPPEEPPAGPPDDIPGGAPEEPPGGPPDEIPGGPPEVPPGGPPDDVPGSPPAVAPGGPPDEPPGRP